MVYFIRNTIVLVCLLLGSGVLKAQEDVDVSVYIQGYKGVPGRISVNIEVYNSSENIIAIQNWKIAEAIMSVCTYDYENNKIYSRFFILTDKEYEYLKRKESFRESFDIYEALPDDVKYQFRLRTIKVEVNVSFPLNIITDNNIKTKLINEKVTFNSISYGD